MIWFSSQLLTAQPGRPEGVTSDSPANLAGGGSGSSLSPTLTRFALLAGAAITCTNSTISGDIGVSPGSAITGFPGLCTVTGQTLNSADSAPGQAVLTAAYNDFTGRACTPIAALLDGMTLAPGTYCVPAAVTNLTTALNFTGSGDHVLVFGSTFITSAGASVNLLNGASCGRVHFVAQSSATIAGSVTGNIIAFSSVTVNNATVTGRALARNASVTLSNSTLSNSCG